MASGAYVLLRTNATSEAQALFADQSNAKFRGVEVNYEWNVLEPARGQFNFQPISQMLATLAPLNKHLVIMLNCKAFNTTNGVPNNTCPSFLKGSANGKGGYYSGTYQTNTSSFDPVYWDPAVQVQLNELYTAFGKFVSNDPNASALEAVCLNESALSQTPSAINKQPCMPYTDAAYISGLTNGMQIINQALPHSVFIQYTNFIAGPSDHSGLASLVANEQGSGVGLGGPDLNPTQAQAGLQAPNGVYAYYPKMAPYVALGTAVEASDTSVPPYINYQFGRDHLKLNYIFWRNTPGFIETVAEMLNNSSAVPQNDPAGGLSSGYPASLSPYLGR